MFCFGFLANDALLCGIAGYSQDGFLFFIEKGMLYGMIAPGIELRLPKMSSDFSFKGSLFRPFRAIQRFILMQFHCLY